MKPQNLQYLACPHCGGDLEISSIYQSDEDRIKSGNLCCEVCQKIYEIINYIPRFVPSSNYADSFGLEWLKHVRTQYDSYSGVSDSEDRFLNDIRDHSLTVIKDDGVHRHLRFRRPASNTYWFDIIYF